MIIEKRICAISISNVIIKESSAAIAQIFRPVRYQTETKMGEMFIDI